MDTVGTNARQKIGSPRKRAKQIKGLTADASALGVSRYFLWMVLKGYATSVPLLERYQKLKGKVV